MGNNLCPFFSVVGGKRASSSMFLLTGSGERGIMKAEQREWNVGERMATILIVEDDVSIHTMIREYLRQQGFSCLDAYSGSEALLVLDTHVPDLVLLDITMPGISGLEVLEEIEKRDPGARVVMCSAVGQEQMIQKAVMLGARDFIVKPFRPDEFRRIIRNAMES